MKGIGIILVVLSHTGGGPLGSWYGSWFSQLFFIIAGYTFNHRYSENLGGYELFVKRIKRLYMPWIAINTILNILNNWLIRINIVTNNPALLEVKSTYIISNVWSINHFWSAMRSMILSHHSYFLAGATWFLPILFFVEIFYAFLEWTCRKICKKNYIIYFDIILIIVFCSGIYFTRIDYTVYRINMIFLSTFLFHIGSKIREFDTDSESKFEPVFKCFISIAIIFILNRLQIGGIRYSRCEIQNGGYLLIFSLAGWYLVYGISELILQSDNVIGKTLVYIGKNTVPIVLLHLISFKIITYIQVIYYKNPPYMLGAFPVLYNFGLWWLAYLIIGIIVPLFFHKIHIKVTNWIRLKFMIIRQKNC